MRITAPLLLCLYASAASPAVVPAESARSVLKAGAEEGDPEARRELAVALSLIASRDPSAKLLETLATDKDVLVRVAAIATIGELGGQQRLPLVKRALADEVPEVAFAAAQVLYRLNPAEGRAIMLSIAEGETKAKSGMVREKLRSLSRSMSTPKSAFLFAFRQSMIFVPLPGAGQGFAAMNSMLSDSEFSARATALVALARDRSNLVRELITDSLQDEDWSVRAVAAQLLAASRRTGERKLLLPLLEDKNRKVRYRAAAAYLHLEYVASHRTPQ